MTTSDIFYRATHSHMVLAAEMAGKWSKSLLCLRKDIGTMFGAFAKHSAKCPQMRMLHMVDIKSLPVPFRGGG